MRNFTIIFLFLLIVFLAPWVKERCTDVYCELSGLEHKITYSNKGSRSEAMHGHLYYNGKEIPDVFTMVQSPDQVFVFCTRSFAWGKDGYFPAKDTRRVAFGFSSMKIDPRELKQGWYIGKEMLKDTPADWLYTEWQDKSAFVAGDAIPGMVSSLKLKTMGRWAGPTLLPKSKMQN